MWNLATEKIGDPIKVVLKILKLVRTSLTWENFNLDQAWATSGPRATYGPPSTLMWPASYI